MAKIFFPLKFMPKIKLRFLIILFFLSLMPGIAGAVSFSKKAVIFNLDQSFANGIINLSDTTSLNRIILTLKKFQEKYEVYALILPNNVDQNKITAVLDRLAQNNIPFVLDVISSDVSGLSTEGDGVHAPYDVKHGIAISTDQLAFYKNKYGPMLAGVRFHELFTASFSDLACQLLNENWCDNNKQNLPSDNFYQRQFVEPYIKFAKENGMFVIWSDWFWSVYWPWNFELYPRDAAHPDGGCHQLQNEQDIRDLAATYPNTIIIAYANNGNTDSSKIDSWYKDISGLFPNVPLRGFGLSDQSWTCKVQGTCPATDLSSWADKAFAYGVLDVQFEPVFYFWNLPEFVWQLTDDYTKESSWVSRGYPTANMIQIASDLGISLNSVCQPGVSTQCSVCKVDGMGWAVDNSKCSSSQICSNGQCINACAPNCSGKSCGDDGCGGSCGACVPNQTCVNNQCVANCVSKTCQSLGFVCGTALDGCGATLSCGSCASNQTCISGQCATSGGGAGGGGGIITPPVTPSAINKPVTQMTRAEIMAKINEIVALIGKLQAQLKAMTGQTIFSCSQITKNLFYGTKNDPQVKCLQEVLKAQGYAVTVSGNYDVATKTAVAQFQQKYAGEILAPYHLARGSGNVGNATKNKLNQLINTR